LIIPRAEVDRSARIGKDRRINRGSRLRSMADHDLDELLSRLRSLLAEQPPSSAAIDIELDLLGERLLDVMHRADRVELVEAWRRLRDLFDSTAAGLDDDCEDDPRFYLGRLAALVGLASAVVHRTPAAELQAAVDHDRLRALLVALRRGSSTSSRALGEATGSSEETVCKDLGRLDRLGLVDSRKAGRRRITHLTLLGEELLAEWEARQRPRARRQAAADRPAKRQRPILRWAACRHLTANGLRR
jgi:DNA-binding MarR family transcriptional regulator